MFCKFSASIVILLILQGSTMDVRNTYKIEDISRNLNEIAVLPAGMGNVASERPPSWLKSAQDMIASPAGHVVVQVAKELLNRSAGNSQVLSLNVTNLMIILLLKILIFTAGMLGAGHWSGIYGGYGGYGGYAARSIDGREENTSNNSSPSSIFGMYEGEDYLITGFLAAQGTGLDDCLSAAACNSPHIAYEYAKAARALLEGIEKFEGHRVQNVRYNDLIVLMETAAYDGLRGMPCNTTIKCGEMLP